MSAEDLKARGVGNPEMFQVLGAFVSYHRKMRLIDACRFFATPPSFKGPDGREIFLDEIGCHEDGASAAIRNVTRGKYESAAKQAANFLQHVYGATPDELQAWLDAVLPRDEPVKQLDEDEDVPDDATSVGGKGDRPPAAQPARPASREESPS